jgi:hypothetical protein
MIGLHCRHASFSISVESSSLALRFASEAAPNSRQDPRAIIGQFTDFTSMPVIAMRASDTRIRVHVHGNGQT